MRNFEIHDLTTNEVLSENLTFEDIPELFGAYEMFYPNHEIVACYREYSNSNGKIIKRFYSATSFKHNDFKSEWLNLVEENICNFY